MCEILPVDAFISACRALEEIQDSYDDPNYRERLLAQARVLESCFQRLLKAAEAEDPIVWHALGNAFNTGRGTKRDRATAIRWYQKAADAGFSPAMVNLGLCFRFPKPGSEATAAIPWFRKAADKRDSAGMVWLGFSYREGDGVDRDYQEAVRWFTKAVEAGDAHSMIHVGRMYAHYLSLPREAVEWFLRAARVVLPESFLELARLYENPTLEVYNPSEAHKWFRVAVEYSEGNSPSALLALARQHISGTGASCDLGQAKFWLRRVLSVSPEKSGSRREAGRLLKELEDRLL